MGFSSADRIVFGEEAYMHLHIISPELRHKGFGVPFVKESARYYFRMLQLHRLYCEPNAFNTAPNRALQRAGFQYQFTHEARPGPINFHQTTTRWMMERTELSMSDWSGIADTAPGSDQSQRLPWLVQSQLVLTVLTRPFTEGPSGPLGRWPGVEGVVDEQVPHRPVPGSRLGKLLPGQGKRRQRDNGRSEPDDLPDTQEPRCRAQRHATRPARATANPTKPTRRPQTAILHRPLPCCNSGIPPRQPYSTSARSGSL